MHRSGSSQVDNLVEMVRSRLQVLEISINIDFYLVKINVFRSRLTVRLIWFGFNLDF